MFRTASDDVNTVKRRCTHLVLTRSRLEPQHFKYLVLPLLGLHIWRGILQDVTDTRHRRVCCSRTLTKQERYAEFVKDLSLRNNARDMVSIGNYKGVMLCNRPFGIGGATTSTVAQVPASSSKQAFVCGQVSTEFGVTSCTKKEKNPSHEHRPKKETALQKHRKWLEQLQSTKEEQEKKLAEDAEAKATRHRKFMEREAKMRALAREAKEAKEDVRRRPMWALTEEQADSAADLHENEEADDLLDFASHLDFDKYINDSEVSDLISSVRTRIRELEAQEKTQQTAAPAATTTKAARLTVDALKNIDGEDAAAQEKKDDDIVSVATQSVLESDLGKELLGTVYSKKSLKATIAERAKQQQQQHRLEAIDEVEEPSALPRPPLIVKHTDDDGSRLEAKHAVSNLPYMHRNPAV